ncbi:MaoC family dehydratase [Ferrimonas pelagia]|uniref:MaoC family dehydratase n=1 Tax=Ferrimonas pelagia TaxID=1177826 RepID=A0ABP9ENF4_9GAMM
MSLTYNQVQIGDKLPPLEIDVSTRLIVATAMASRDYQNVHHDRDAAQSLGSEDIFMNILTTNGLVGRFVTDWTGPTGLLNTVNIKLGVPNYAGDRMKLMGKVSAKHANNQIEIDVVGKNSMGNHVNGTVLVTLPEGDA